MLKTNIKSIWFLASQEKRDYVTPEDIDYAIKNGADKKSLYREVLEAISTKSCEDVSCCAFVAISNRKSKNNA